MIFYCVILLSLCWPQTRCIKDNTEGTFDQIATASENVAHAIRQSNASTKNHQERLSSVPAPIGATVRYENSNGFVPMIAAATLSYDATVSSSSRTNDLEQQDGRSNESNATNAVSAPDSSSDVKSDKLEEDLAYSSEARIFLNLPGPPTNRRSSDVQEGPSAFELLKVNNDTPAVANYQDFYENVHGTVNTEIVSPDSSTSRHPSAEKGRKVNNYIPNYGKQSHQTGDENIYTRYYLYNGAQDAKKTTHEQEKVTGNYRQQSTANYDGHGQSAAGQNAVPSSSRTNYETNEPTHGETYDVTTESSRTPRHRFFKPVVVAESSNEADTKHTFGNQLQNDAGLGAGYKTSRNLESSSSEASGSYEVYNDGNRQRNYHRLDDPRHLSDDSTEYADHIERPRRMQKNRRRPAHVDASRKPPKEHTPDDGAEEQDKHKYSVSRLKSQRYKVKANPWLNDAAANHQDASDEEDVKYDHRGNVETKSTKSRYGSRSKNTNNAWSQASPNLGISHSTAIELDHLEKPNYVVPFNLVPLTNFDHSTALGNSQGFDVSNAMLHNFVTAAPIGAYTTTAPLLSTPQPVLAQNLAFQKNLGVSTSDVIVGQNTFQNPLQTVLLPQSNGQGKIAEPLRTTYLPSTVTPVFALTSSLTPTLQSVRLQNVQGNVTPTTGSVVQHIPVNQVHPGVQQLIVPTAQTFPSFLQTPFQIQVNPHGLQGQNLISQGNPLGQGLSTTPATPESRINGDSRKKSANILTSASLTIGQNEQKHTAVNGNYLQNHHAQAVKPKTFVQASQVVPTVQTLSGIALSAQQLPDALALQRSRDQQDVKLQGNGADDAMQQFQAQLGRMQLMKGNKFPGIILQTADNTASHTNNVNNVNALITPSGQAHLPNVGAKNVEIVNPNIKPSPIDTTVNAFGTTMHYPTAVFTTPIPIFSTITPVTPHTVTLQNYVNSLTESGTKTKQLGVLLDPKTSQTTERPMFNPINFIPNLDIIKNQNALNNKLPINEPLQPGLSLVPVMPGGNFFKPSFSAQNELIIKPKLASDLQQYAEEMFKESLKTMYNSQKWNNDRKPYGNNSEANDLAKLRLELQKLKASLDPKYRDILEAHQSENKVRATDAFKYDGDKKNPDVLLQTLEQLLKNRPAESIHIYHGSSRPGRKQKPTEDANFGSDFGSDDFKSDSRLKEFLTPPRPDSFRGPFHEKPVKKRPETPRYKTGPRKRPSSTRPINLETSASNIDIYLDGSQHRRPSFDHDSDLRHQSSFDTYPTFTKPTPSAFRSALRELKTRSRDYDINHPRVHNYLGMLMKNKQLPTRNTHYLREKDKLRQFFDNEKHRLHQEFYDDALKDYLLNKYEGASRSGTAGTVAGRKVYSRNGTT